MGGPLFFLRVGPFFFAFRIYIFTRSTAINPDSLLK